jgi:hypothetical protein
MEALNHAGSLILWDFLRIMDRIYGMYSDSCAGGELFAEKIRGMMGQARDRTVFLLVSDDPNAPDAKYNHAVKIGALIDRNAHDGENQVLLSRSCLVFLYTIWDTVRPVYAQAVGCDQKEIVSDVFGDLRHYRHAIVHNDSRLAKQPAALKFIQLGELVSLRREQMDDLFRMLFDEVDRINAKFTGESLKRPFDRNLNPESASPRPG